MKFFSFLIPIVIVFMTVFVVFETLDDSDAGFWDRSGMRVLTDNYTGCQYLAGLLGSPTPRLDRNEKQICEKR